MKRSIRKVLGFAICFCGLAAAQNGPVTSNLKNVLVYFYGYSSDHANTPEWCGYLMKLGPQHGFTVDTTSDPAAFTTANLANYQAIVLYNAYYIGEQMSAAQKDALRSWYRGNRGMACFHQCVKNSWAVLIPTGMTA